MDGANPENWVVRCVLFAYALCSSVSRTGPFKKQYFKVCSIIQAIGESGGQVVMSDSAGSCAEGMSTSTKSSTGSGILTLTLKGSKRISLQLITLIESIQCKEIYLWTKKFLFFILQTPAVSMLSEFVLCTSAKFC